MRIDKYLNPKLLEGGTILVHMGITPGTIQYLRWLSESLPDLNRSGFAIEPMRDSVGRIIEYLDNAIDTHLSITPETFEDNIHLIHEQLQIKIKEESDYLIAQGIEPLGINQVDHCLQLNQILEGPKKLTRLKGEALTKLLKYINWDNIHYDMHRYLNPQAYDSYESSTKSNFNPNEMCRELGILAISCPKIMSDTLFIDHLNAVESSAHAVLNKINADVPLQFGNYGILVINLSNYLDQNLGEMYKNNGNIVMKLPNKKVVAHEWMHLLDNVIGSIHGVGLESEDKHEHKSEAPLAIAMGKLIAIVSPTKNKTNDTLNSSLESISIMLKALCKKDTFSITSEYIDWLHNKKYWNTTCEKLARAFEEYIYPSSEKNIFYPSKHSQNKIDTAFNEFFKQTIDTVNMLLSDQQYKWNSNLQLTIGGEYEQKHIS